MWQQKRENFDVYTAVKARIDKFLSKPLFFGAQINLRAQSDLRARMGAQIQIARPIETQLETLSFALYNLNSTYNLHF